MNRTGLPPQRGGQRYNHITLPLHVLHGGQWHAMEARGWNPVGFNFFSTQALDLGECQFRRQRMRFPGCVVWKSDRTDEAAVESALVNELLFKRAQQALHDAPLKARLLKLIRVEGRVAEKRQVLEAMGIPIAEDRWRELVFQQQNDRPLLHYGVRVQDEVWNALVARALSVSNVVLTLEKWSAQLRHRSRFAAGLQPVPPAR